MQGLVWFLAMLLVGFSASPSWSRGGGGCLREGTLVLTPDGPVAVEKLREGDTVLGVNGNTLGASRVEAVTKLKVEDYLEVSAGEEKLLITPEHPVMVGKGEFRIAGRIHPGDHVVAARAGVLEGEVVDSVFRIPADRPAYNLLVNPGGTFIPESIVVHNKGCFLPDSLILKSDGTEVPISGVQPGDTLLAFTSEGRVVETRVRNVLRVVVDEHVVLKTDRETLRVTLDHPFYVGEGTFKTLDVLQVGDSVIAWDGQSLGRQNILSVERVPGRIEVYNLQTETPHTFFVGHVAVHNKGGGGGCFPPGTMIATPKGDVPIESLIPGDEIFALTDQGARIPARVRALLAARNVVLKVETSRGILEASPEHPVGERGGGFLPLLDLHRGDRLLQWEGGRLVSSKVRKVSPASGETLVFNLQVDEPHTFLASNFLVHNKGGSSSSSHSSVSHSSSSSSSTDDSMDWVGWLVMIFWFGGFGALIIFMIMRARRGSKKENLDFVYSRSMIGRKAKRTEKVLQFLSQQDPGVSPDTLRKVAESTFRKLQECWEKRDYGPMESLVMPSLFAQHTAQLRGMVKNHEINRIEKLKVEKVDLVNVRYTEKPNQREFTALVSAVARDYYVHDSTGKFLRGDSAAAKFQEFWTFQRQDNRWLLREVEQSGESDYLKDENFTEMLTDQNLQGIYGETAGKEGPAGPWLEKGVEQKATRIERLLNFLVQTDKLWNRQTMLERAREVFLKVYLAREAGDPKEVPKDDLFPEVAESLSRQIRQWRDEGITAEYRNLCVRKAELIHVRNFDDRARDEFTVRISAHAQTILRKGDRVMSEDQFVTDFEDHWTFGRLDERWKLKEVLPPTQGKKRISDENLDEDSSAEQMKWYYRQTRAN